MNNENSNEKNETDSLYAVLQLTQGTKENVQHIPVVVAELSLHCVYLFQLFLLIRAGSEKYAGKSLEESNLVKKQVRPFCTLYIPTNWLAMESSMLRLSMR